MAAEAPTFCLATPRISGRSTDITHHAKALLSNNVADTHALRIQRRRIARSPPPGARAAGYAAGGAHALWKASHRWIPAHLDHAALLCERLVGRLPWSRAAPPPYNLPASHLRVRDAPINREGSRKQLLGVHAADGRRRESCSRLRAPTTARCDLINLHDLQLAAYNQTACSRRGARFSVCPAAL